MCGPIGGVLGATLGGGTLFGSLVAGEQARREGKKANQINRKIEELKLRRQKQETLREAQVARASLQQQAANAGVLQTTGAQQGVQSIEAQATGNLQFIDQINTLQQQSSERLQAAQDFQNASALLGRTSSIFTSFAPS